MARPGPKSGIILLLALLGGALAPSYALSQALPEAYRGGPFYKDLVADVARLEILGRMEGEGGCSRDYLSPNPCALVKKTLDEIIAKHELPPGKETMVMLQAYAEKEYDKADKLYAAARGFALPEHLAEKPRSDVASDIASYGIRKQTDDDTSCKNDLTSPKPCTETMQAYAQFTRERGLPQNAQTMKMFTAFVEGDKEEGERLYAAVTGKGEKQPRNEILADVMHYNVPAEVPDDTSCRNNYFAAKPCPAAVTAWKDFSRRHGLDLTQQTANLFQAYLQGDTVKGDKLYAAAKGISVADLLRERGVAVDENGQPLYVPIWP